MAQMTERRRNFAKVYLAVYFLAMLIALVGGIATGGFFWWAWLAFVFFFGALFLKLIVPPSRP